MIRFKSYIVVQVVVDVVGPCLGMTMGLCPAANSTRDLSVTY